MTQDQKDTVSTSVLFLEHAKGYRTERALRERRDEILNAFEEKLARPTRALLEELAEINIRLGDAGESL